MGNRFFSATGPIREWLQLDEAEQERWMEGIHKPPSEQTPEERERTRRVAEENAKFIHTPIELMNEEEREMHTISLAMHQLVETMASRDLNPEPERQRSEMYDMLIASTLHDHPPLQEIQTQVDYMFKGPRGNGQSIDIPNFLIILSKQLGRKPKFNNHNAWVPTAEQLSEHFLSLHSRDFEAHSVLCHFLVRAATYDEPPHPKGCACLLCSHIARVMNSGRSK